MASQARQAFDDNATDIERLLDLHKLIGGNSKGRRYGLEVLNKSAIVLLTSFWEAYCEDIAAEALQHIVTHAPSADKLPTELQKLIANELKSDKHDLAIWQIADSGWKSVLNARLVKLQAERNRKLNTPKTAQIDKLFLDTIGIPQISNGWKWPTKMTVVRTRQKLDEFIELRGSIAHRGSASQTVKKIAVTDYFDFLKRLVGKTGGAVNSHVTKITGKRLWT